MFLALISLRHYVIRVLGCCVFLGLTAFAFEIIYNVCTQHTHHLKLQRQSLISCAQNCYCFNTCAYFGYNIKMALCDIYDSQPDIDDRKCQGYLLISKSSATTIAGRIDRKECSLYDTNICQGPPGNRGWLGNTHYRGSIRIVVCKPSYAIDGLRNTTCMESGEWSNHGTCTKVCPVFKLTNINIVITQIEIKTTAGLSNSTNIMSKPLFEGTRVSFSCINGGSLHGEHTVNCEDGSWTQFPTCHGSMRKPCQTDMECIDKYSECRNNLCWCKAGLSHDPCSFSCVAICPGSYGDTFQVIDNYGIRGYNYVSKVVNNSQACLQLCQSNEDYICKYAEYSLRYNSECNLNKIPKGQTPYIEDAHSYTFYQRDCASCEL